MSANEDWDKWSDKLIETILRILTSEGSKYQRRSVVHPSRTPEDDLDYTKIVTNVVGGNQVYLNTVKKRKKVKSRANSIGQIYEAAILASGSTLE